MDLKNLKTTDKGAAEICEHEGIVVAPYRDTVGVWTWGLGHTAAAGGPDPARMAMSMPSDIDGAIDAAFDQFRIDLAGYESRVNKAIKVGLRPHQFDALVSFDFNTGGIFRAILTRRINANDPAAAASFMGWLKPPEIRKRRTAEMRLFETGDYDANGNRILIYGTNGAGRLGGVIRTVTGAEVIERLRSKSAPHPDDLPQMFDVGPAEAAARAAEAAAGVLADAQAKVRREIAKLKTA